MKASGTLKLLVLLLVVPLILAGCDTLLANDNTDALQAAGVIEAVNVTVAPELGGRVAEVFVTEGDAVAVGDPLLRLADETLVAQRAQAEAALEGAQADADTAAAGLSAAQATRDASDTAQTTAEAAVAMADAGITAAQAGVATAQAALDGAHVQYEMAVAAARQAAQPSRVEAWNQELPDEFNTPPWYFQDTELLAAAEAEVAAAKRTLEAEQASLAAMAADARYQDFQEAEARLAEAQAAFLVAQELLTRQVANNGEAPIEAYVQELYDTAEAELQAAQQAYQQKLSDQATVDLLEARGRVAAAQERYEIARDRRDGLLTGEEALVVQAAATGVQQAEAGVQQAEAQVSQAEAARQQAEAQVAQAAANATQVEANIAQAEAVLARAQKGVAQAQAALDQIDLQMEKLVVHAAVAGTVMTRNVQPGEVIQPGATVLTIANLDTLTVTVYMPEDQYGQVRLGEQATLTVDSFPNESFDAVVTRIADQAEFTPRNVQTQEERQSTVYAVELAVQENGGKLKPGMPADVRFE